MASSSSEEKKHKNNKLCNFCSHKITEFVRNHICIIFDILDNYIQKNAISLLDITNKIDSSSFDAIKYGIFKTQSDSNSSPPKYKRPVFPLPSSSKDTISSISSSSTKLEDIKKIKIVDITVIRAPFSGKQNEESKSFKNPCEIYVTIENIQYMDVEVMLKLLKSMNYLFESNIKNLSDKMECSNSVPRMLIEDIIIHLQEESYIRRKQCKTITMEIKGILYNEKTSKDIDFDSTLLKKSQLLIDKTTEILCERLANKTVIELHPYDIDFLNEKIKLLFSNVYDDEIIECDYHLIKCRNPKFIDHTFKDYHLSNKIDRLTNLCDAIFCIKNYNIIYMLSILKKYTLLIHNNHYKTNGNNKFSAWNMVYFGVEKNLMPKSSIYDCDDIILGFCIESIEKDDEILESTSEQTEKKKVRFNDNHKKRYYSQGDDANKKSKK